MTESNRTELPWKYNGVGYTDCGYKYHEITHRNGVDEVIGQNGVAQEDAEFIVKACNNHYRLLEVLEVLKVAYDRGLLHDIENRDVREAARQAIKDAS